ncbi:MAG: hypothetical protein JJU06_10135, partial [Ectothiorhodospiraceae bacterium]|nr:hypothetical protein [Ectothiorhodospiraceae bacterium]
AFEAERQHWIDTGQAHYEADAEPPPPEPEGVDLADGESAVEGHVHGSLWALDVKVGDQVEPGQQLLVLESMKMEIPVLSDTAGTVTRVLCKEGGQITPGQVLLIIKEVA